MIFFIFLYLIFLSLFTSVYECSYVHTSLTVHYTCPKRKLVHFHYTGILHDSMFLYVQQLYVYTTFSTIINIYMGKYHSSLDIGEPLKCSQILANNNVHTSEQNPNKYMNKYNIILFFLSFYCMRTLTR